MAVDKRIVKLIAMLATQFLLHAATAQLCGEVTFRHLPECHLMDVTEHNGKYYALISSAHDLQDTNVYNDRIEVIQLTEDVQGKFDTVTVFRDVAEGRGQRAIDIDRLDTQWVLLKYLTTPEYYDSIIVGIANHDFSVHLDDGWATHGTLFSYTSVVQNGTLTGIGTISGFPDSLFSVRLADTSSNVRFELFTTMPSISPVSSLVYNQQDLQFTAFHYSGISHLDDSLNIIEQFPASVVRTSQYGSLLFEHSKYFSFGITRVPGNVNRCLALHCYNDEMIPIKADTLGWEDQDNYPLLNESIAKSGAELLVGGHLGGAIPIVLQYENKYFIAKYNREIEQIWYHEYGGDKSFRINGIIPTANNYYLIYGAVAEVNTKIYYPYIHILKPDGLSTSTTEAETLADKLTPVVITNPGTTPMRIYSNEPISIFSLYSIDGKQLATRKNLSVGHNTIRVDELPAGAYFYIGKTRSGKSFSGKWIKQQ